MAILSLRFSRPAPFQGNVLLGPSRTLTPTDRGTIFFGARFEIENCDNGDVHAYCTVGPDETDARKGRISIDSPLARAALKKLVDEEFEAELPRGKVRFMVLSVQYSQAHATPPPTLAYARADPLRSEGGR